jgi:hypothetical protein
MLSRQLIRAEPDLLKLRAAQAGRTSVPRVSSRGQDDRSIVPATAIGAQRVLALQRSVGNRAAGHLLSCRERATPTYRLVGRRPESSLGAPAPVAPHSERWNSNHARFRRETESNASGEA